MNYTEGIAVIEALLFASGEPSELVRLSKASGIEAETIIKLINMLNSRYAQEQSALRITRLGDSFQLVTREEYADYIKVLLSTKRNAPLSQAALEVLSAVAYNQPVTKAFVEQVRGVDSSATVNNLVERGLLEEAGRLDLPGRPVTFRTTAHFLLCFGMTDISQLPEIPDGGEQLSLDELEENMP